MAGTALTDAKAIAFTAGDLAQGRALGIDPTSAQNALQTKIQDAAALVYQLQQIPSLAAATVTALGVVATDLT